MGCAVQGVNAQLGSEGYWGSIVTYAIRTGFSGALSTVSTFVAEVSPAKPTLHCSSPHIHLAQAFAAQAGLMQMQVAFCSQWHQLEGALAVPAGAWAAEDGAGEIARLYLLGGFIAGGSSAGCRCVRKHVVGELNPPMGEESKKLRKL